MPERVDSDSVYSESLQLQNTNEFWSERYARWRALRFTVYGAFKRAFDFTMSVFLLTVLSPVFVIVALAIKIDSPGPAIFRQERTGKNGKTFYICKFRSMAVDNDIRDASRSDECTRIGKRLRRSSLDELPQLINVALGQMSFIGPRPWVTEYWTNMTEEERERSLVRPGITGLAAAKGRNGLTIFQKIDYDLEYVHNFSLWQDIKIILLTMRQVTHGSEASEGKEGIHNEIDALRAR